MKWPRAVSSLFALLLAVLGSTACSVQHAELERETAAEELGRLNRSLAAGLVNVSSAAAAADSLASVLASSDPGEDDAGSVQRWAQRIADVRTNPLASQSFDMPESQPGVVADSLVTTSRAHVDDAIPKIEAAARDADSLLASLMGSAHGRMLALEPGSGAEPAGLATLRALPQLRPELEALGQGLRALSIQLLLALRTGDQLLTALESGPGAP